MKLKHFSSENLRFVRKCIKIYLNFNSTNNVENILYSKVNDKCGNILFV